MQVEKKYPNLDFTFWVGRETLLIDMYIVYINRRLAVTQWHTHHIQFR
jgi:hypothetical protein